MLDCCGGQLLTLFDSLFLSSVGRRRRRDLHHLIIFVFSWHLPSSSQLHKFIVSNLSFLFSIEKKFSLSLSLSFLFTLLLPPQLWPLRLTGGGDCHCCCCCCFCLCFFCHRLPPPSSFPATDLAVQFSVCATLSVAAAAAAAANHSVVLGICQQQQQQQQHRHSHRHQHQQHLK